MSDRDVSLAFHLEYLDDGDATLTLAGPVQAVQQAAGLVLQHLTGMFEPMPAPVDEFPQVLTATELDAMAVGERVLAGAFAQGRSDEPVLWMKLNSHRWDSQSTYGHTYEGEPGVSSIWLANNRQPKRLT